MTRSKTSSFVIMRPIRIDKWSEEKLARKFDAVNRIYNVGVTHCRKNLDLMRNDKRYQEILLNYKNITKEGNNPEHRKELSNQLTQFRINYGLTEYGIQEYLCEGYKHSRKGCLCADIVQNIASELSAAVDSAIFNGTEIHYRKYGQTMSFFGKRISEGIIYKPKSDSIYMNRIKYGLKPVRETDHYLQEAMAHRIKYCGITRKPFSNGYHYFAIFVMEGDPPVKDEHLYPDQIHKHTLGQGIIGIDEGTTTCAYYGNSTAGFVELAEDVKKYNTEIVRCSQIYERRVRINNPDCYNKNGTRINGIKNYNYTNGMSEALMWLKNAYRKKSVYVKQKHNILANEIISNCDTVVKEPMKFNQLAKKSKSQTERENKETTITDKKGNSKQIRKFKKKRRFGKSVTDRSPGLFNTTVETKIKRLGGTVKNVNLQEYKASQYNHITKEAVKPKLSERTKYIGDKLVQRDLYSAFLLSNMKDEKTIDFEECELNFDNFLAQQEDIINKLIDNKNLSKNFEIKDFLKTRQSV